MPFVCLILQVIVHCFFHNAITLGDVWPIDCNTKLLIYCLLCIQVSVLIKVVFITANEGLKHRFTTMFLNTTATTMQ